MPEKGINYVHRNSLLTYEEIERICTILSANGVEKLRITGGEPFVRQDLSMLLQILRPKFKSLHVTTNGTRLVKYRRFIEELPLDSVNLSLDTLKAERFHSITRRDVFDEVWAGIGQLLKTEITLNLNVVVVKNVNDDEIIPFCELARKHKLNIRFIESMPFNGSESTNEMDIIDHRSILRVIKCTYPEIQELKIRRPASSVYYYIRGFHGHIGIIPAFSRTQCGTCNRLRISPTGVVKTCLYDKGVFNVRDLIRAGATDDQLTAAIQDAVLNKPVDGFVAEKNSRNSSFFESMATIGG